MAEYQSTLLSVSSSENRDSFGSSNAEEAFQADEGFYEEIQAPKFVDFTAPDHYCPDDDRYWFCLRVGCDQKHEEEMDSEAIYNKFVLRVMAARSPNVRLRKALEWNASKKCPLSAPPKPSNPRLSRTAIISSISNNKKVDDDKEKVVRPLLKPRLTPPAKTKPVAAKYLTTPRNKKCCIQNGNSFRSVQNPKPSNREVSSKGPTVAKTLVFHSPKKIIKVKKTSVELRTPVSKLCQGMNKLEISSQRKLASKSSRNSSSNCSSRQLSSREVKRKPEELLLSSKIRTNQESKFGKSVRSTIKGKLSQQEAPKNEESHEIKQSLTHNSEREGGNCLDLEERNNSRSQATSMQENNSSDGKENNIDYLAASNSSEGERDLDHECMDGDDKENAAASHENRMHSKNLKQNGRKTLAMQDQCGQVRKKVTQARDKISKESLISSSVKLKKPKATNPKPFRLRTDERGILKEANLDRRTVRLAPPQSESATLNTLSVKLHMIKQGNDIQDLKIPKGYERSSKAAAASMTPETRKHQARKVIESNAMQRLEKFRKIKYPLQKHSIRPQGLVSTKNETTSSFLIPGRKLDVIHENSPEVLELKKVVGKTNAPPGDDAAACAASRSSSSSHGRRPITVTKKLK